jgi:hypothetical protein
LRGLSADNPKNRAEFSGPQGTIGSRQKRVSSPKGYRGAARIR